MAYCTFIRPIDVEGAGETDGVVFDGLEFRRGETLRREHAGAVAGMDAGFFDVLHDAGDQHVFAVGQAVHVDFGGVFEEAVDQHGALLREGHGFTHVLANGVFFVGDDHGASAEHVAGTHEHRVSQTAGDVAGFFDAGRGAVFWRRNLQVVEQLAEEFAVFGEIDVLGIGADDRDAEALQWQGEIERRLSAELHDDAVGLLDIAQCLKRFLVLVARSRGDRWCRNRSKRFRDCS